MKKRLLILLCLIMACSMAACGKKAKPEGQRIIWIDRWPSQYKIYRMAGDSPEKVKEMYGESMETYDIFSSGDVSYNGEVVKRLSAEDWKMIQQCYDRMCKENVTIEDNVIPDIGYTYVFVDEYGEDQEFLTEHSYSWGTTERCKEAGDILAVLYPYFEHPAVWETTTAE